MLNILDGIERFTLSDHVTYKVRFYAGVWWLVNDLRAWL